MSHLKKEFQLAKIKFGILFETSRYFNPKVEEQYLSDEKIDQIVKDVVYLVDNLGSSSDLSLNIFIYLSRLITNIHRLMEPLNRLKNRYPFLRYIGDEVYWFSPLDTDFERYRLFDSISLYNPHISNEKVLENFWESITILYDKWIDFCNHENLYFIPTVLPGFDDSIVRPDAKIL